MGKGWTGEEEQFVMKCLSLGYSYEKIAPLVGRSPSAVLYLHTKIKNRRNKLIYVLLCRKGRFFVGTAKDMHDYEVLRHFCKRGSIWLKKYPPLSVIERIVPVSGLENDKVKQYMREFGIDYVRGGNYSGFNFTRRQRSHLQWELYQ